MNHRILPPEAIPILEENPDISALRITKRIKRKRSGLRSLIRGVLIGISLPLTVVAIDDLSKNAATIKEKLSSSGKQASPVSGKEVDPFDDDIPEETHLIIDEYPEITDAQWYNSTLSFLYNGTEAQVTMKQRDKKMTFCDLSLGCTDIHLAQPIEHAHLVTVLKNASQALAHMEKGGFDIQKLTSDDGARFEFSTANHRQYVTTINGLYHVAADHPASHTFPRAPRTRILRDTVTNDSIAETFGYDVTWDYKRGTTPITDTFAAHMLQRQQVCISPTHTTITEFHPGTMTPESITHWNIQNDPITGSWTKKERSTSQYFCHNGSLSQETDWINQTANHYDEKGALFLRENFCITETVQNGKVYASHNTTSCILYHHGEPIRMYPEEKKLNPTLTPEQYVKRLADALDSHRKIHTFAQRYWEYVHDSPDPHNPLRKGTEANHGDYVQTAIETVQRVEHDKMLGDCDDFSELMKTITRLQKKNSHTIGTITDSPSGKPGNHVFCSWVEKRTDGRFDGFSLDMDGLRQNALLYSHDRENERGSYPSISPATQAVFRQYPKGGDRHTAHRIVALPLQSSTHHLYEHPVTSHEFNPAHMYEPKDPQNQGRQSIINACALLGVVFALHLMRKRKDEE